VASQKRILALNIGASQLTLAEFKVSAGKAPMLVQYGIKPLGIDPDSDLDPSGYIIAALRDVLKEKGIRPGPVSLSISGQAVFPRFVKLPPVAKDKVYAMVREEAEQNVPFPIDEIIWDYQLIGDASSGEQAAMIVAAKTENVANLVSCVQAAGLEPTVVDVAPLSLYNCARYNYPQIDGCAMVLDIGSRSTNLLFVEDGKVFYRSIPVAGNTITQEIAKALGIGFQEAEELKRKIGFVALGGNTASDDEQADRVSKVIRNVVTRLHAEVNRSINFYRSQQDGSSPSHVLLTGGTSITAYMDTFFREKLKVEVEYLNPFVSVEVGGRVSPEKVGEDFYQLGEVVGLALRASEQAPVQINLVPPTIIAKKAFQKRIPFFAVAGVALIGAAVALLLNGMSKQSLSEEKRGTLRKELSGFEKVQDQVEAEVKARDAVAKDLNTYRALVDQRSIALLRLDALRSSLLDGMWLTSVESVRDSDGVVVALNVTGRGFSDKLTAAEEKAARNGGRKTAVELFSDRLRATEAFLDDVRIVQEKFAEGLSDKVREFKLEIPLAESFQIRKAGK
jgi:type IV pilus assembly protein PilM